MGGAALPAVLEAGEVVGLRHPASVDVARGEAEEYVGRARVGPDLVGVEWLFGAVAVVEPLRLGPVEKVGGGGGLDVAHAVGRAALKVAEIGSVFAAVFVPEGQVQGVEVALGDDGVRDVFILATHEGEVEAVRGPEGIEGTRRFAGDDGFVLGPLLAGWIRVLKYCGIAGTDVDAREAIRGENDVVVAVALEFDEAEGGFGPALAVAALCIADKVGVGIVYAAAAHDVVPGAVVHADAAVTVLEDGAVEAGVALAGGVGLHDDFALDGRMEAEVEAVCQLGDEEVVDEGFKAGADIDRFGVCGGGTAHGCHLLNGSGQWLVVSGQ